MRTFPADCSASLICLLTAAPALARFGELDPSFGNGGTTLIDFDPEDHAFGKIFGAAFDAHRTIVVRTYDTGVSDASGHDCTDIFVARPQSPLIDEIIFIDGFDG